MIKQANAPEGPYGSDTSVQGLTLALPDDAIPLGTFELGNNYKAATLQLLPTGIIDRTGLFWSGPENSFWFKTHDDRVFLEMQVDDHPEDDSNNVTLDNVSVSKQTLLKFTNQLQKSGEDLTDFIVRDLAPLFLSAKNAVWTAQQELRQITGDQELNLEELEPSYNTYLRKAVRYRLAQFVCDQFDIPDAALHEIMGREVPVQAEQQLRSLIQGIVNDMKVVTQNGNKAKG